MSAFLSAGMDAEEHGDLRKALLLYAEGLRETEKRLNTGDPARDARRLEIDRMLGARLRAVSDLVDVQVMVADKQEGVELDVSAPPAIDWAAVQAARASLSPGLEEQQRKVRRSALSLLEEATKMDEAGRYSSAVHLYTEGLSRLLLLPKTEEVDRIARRCLERAETLRGVEQRTKATLSDTGAMHVRAALTAADKAGMAKQAGDAAGAQAATAAAIAALDAALDVEPAGSPVRSILATKRTDLAVSLQQLRLAPTLEQVPMGGKGGAYLDPLRRGGGFWG